MAKVIIKKYPNRRLYNTQISSYISTNDLLELIKKNVDFKVIECKTNEDITKSILIQLILEQETKSYHLIPNEILKQMIILFGNNHGAVFLNFLNTYIGNFSQQNTKEKQFSANSSFKIIDEISATNMKIVDEGIKLFFNSFKMGDKTNE